MCARTLWIYDQLITCSIFLFTRRLSPFLSSSPPGARTLSKFCTGDPQFLVAISFRSSNLTLVFRSRLELLVFCSGSSGVRVNGPSVFLILETSNASGFAGSSAMPLSCGAPSSPFRPLDFLVFEVWSARFWSSLLALSPVRSLYVAPGMRAGSAAVQTQVPLLFRIFYF